MRPLRFFYSTTIGSKIVRSVGIVLVCTAAHAASAQCLNNEPLRGVNLSGAEFNSSRVPGALNKDYVYPNDADIDYIRSIGGNIIRLPFRWERVQPILFQPLDPAEVRELAATVSKANSRGQCVILDVHNYAVYRGQPIGSTSVPADAFYDLWKRLAAQFNDPDKTIYGLMNEPAKISIDQWAPVAQQAVDEIRKTGSKNLILAPGGRWSGAHEWLKPQGATSNAIAFAGFRDPLNRTWLEVHQYADGNYSGTKQECVDPSRLKKIMGDVTAWARQNGKKLFLGEFGVASNENCLAALDTMLEGMSDTSVWRGWTYWAAGRWWGNYPMSIQPKNGSEAPQTAVLKKYFSSK